MSGLPEHLLRDVDALLKRIADRKVIASISGGKDSAAMSLYLTELGIEHDRVFMDTGWEHEATYEYLRGELTEKIGPITELRAPLTMVELIKKKKMFPSRVRRFCTEELKVFPLQRHLNEIMDAGDDVVSAVGIRRAESLARWKMPEWEWSKGFDCEVWRPLVNWTMDDVVAIHSRHGLHPNPLYLQGATRVGCWPCIFSRKAEIRFLADRDPGRIDLIRALEGEMTEGLRARCEERGEEMKWSELTFFQGFNKADRTNGQTWPIDKVVSWSRTSRGGKQLEMFAPAAHEQGCMRWGLCDHGEDGQ